MTFPETCGSCIMIIRIPREFTADQGSTVIIKLNILTVQYMKHSSPDTTGIIIIKSYYSMLALGQTTLVFVW